MGRLFILLSIFALCACNSEFDKTHQKHDYDEVIDLHVSYLDIFNIELDEYYIYYYQIDCYYCHGIKSRIIEFALRSDINLYFINIEKDEGFLSHSLEDTIGASDPYYAFCFKTPQLSKVVDHKITETYLGDKDILILIE